MQREQDDTRAAESGEAAKFVKSSSSAKPVDSIRSCLGHTVDAIAAGICNRSARGEFKVASSASQVETGWMLRLYNIEQVLFFCVETIRTGRQVGGRGKKSERWSFSSLSGVPSRACGCEERSYSGQSAL